MGIKQFFASAAAETSEEALLRDAWAAEGACSDAEGACSNVMVFDGTNFMIGLMSHRDLSTASILAPRMKEYFQVLKRLLGKVVEECPGVDMHFVFDGLPFSAELESKAKEKECRQLKKVVGHAADAEQFCLDGHVPRATSFASSAARRCLRCILDGLPGGHRLYRAHGRDRDLDMAAALHALKHRARILVSGDSDFLVLFPRTVVQVNSLRLAREGLFAKPITLAGRCAALGVGSHDEVRVLGALLGTDFSPELVALAPQGPRGCRGHIPAPQHMSLAAQEAGQLVADHGSWQEAVRSRLAAAGHGDVADAFLENFDADGYEEQPAPGGCESWACRRTSVLAYGLTQTYPEPQELARLDLDPLLQSMREWRPLGDGPEEDEGSLMESPLHPARLLRAYALDWITPGKLSLLRFGAASISSCHADAAPGQPLACARKDFVQRLVTYLNGPEKVRDSWDDDDDDDDDDFGHPVTPLVCRHEVFSAPAAQQQLQLQGGVAGLVQMRRPRPWEAFDKVKEEEELGRLVGGLDPERLTSVSVVEPLEEGGPVLAGLREMWGELRAARGAPDEERAAAMGRCILLLATGRRLEALADVDQQMVRSCVSSARRPSDECRLFCLCLSILGRRHLVPEQLDQLQASLGLSRKQYVEAECPNFAQTGATFDGHQCACSALALGGFCHWLLDHLQDCFCLCGGDGLLLPSLVHKLDGGPVVLTGGLVQKGDDGYKLTVGTKERSPPAEALIKFVSSLGEEVSGCTAQLVKHWIKLTGVSAEAAFGLNARIRFLDGVPYTLRVSRLGSW